MTIYKNQRVIPCTLAEGSPGNYRVNFAADGPARYEIRVHFNGQEISGSPFKLDIADASQVAVYGEQLKTAAVGRPAHFFANAAGASPQELTVLITGGWTVAYLASGTLLRSC